MLFFPGHFPGSQFHHLDGGQLFRPGETRHHNGQGGGIVEVRVLVELFAHQGRLHLAADGIIGEVFLHPVIRVVGDVADPATVDDGGLFLLRQEAVELRVVAGGDDQGVDGPAESVHLDVPVLDHAEVDLHEVLLVLEDLVAEVDAPAGDPGQGSAPQVEPVRVVGVAQVEEALDGFLPEQVHGGRGDLVLGGVFPGDGAEALAQGDGDDLEEIQHVADVPAGRIPDVVEDVVAAGSQGPVRGVEPLHLAVGEPGGFRHPGHVLLLRWEEVHGEDHRVLKGLRLDHPDFPVILQPVDVAEIEGVPAVALLGDEMAVQGAQGIDEEGLAVSGLADEDEGHFAGRASLGGVLDEGDEAVDLVEHADDVLRPHPEDLEIVGALPVDDHLFDIVHVFKDHPGNGLEAVFKSPLFRLHLGKVKGQCVRVIFCHDRPPLPSLWVCPTVPGNRQRSLSCYKQVTYHLLDQVLRVPAAGLSGGVCGGAAGERAKEKGPG